jgi:hypothetical protein
MCENVVMCEAESFPLKRNLIAAFRIVNGG